MDMYSYYSDLSDLSPSPPILDLDNNNIGTSSGAAIEDEILLASSNPKKRAGRKKFRETRHPVFRGIRQRDSGKWVCEVREPNKSTRIWLGTFPTVEMAARAHDVAALALRGRSACLNFADSAWRLRIPTSTDPKEIQRAAAEAAEEFRPSMTSLQSETEEGDVVMSFPRDDAPAYGGMQGFCGDMADQQGPMLSPPHHTGFYFNESMNDVEFYDDMSLWNY